MAPIRAAHPWYVAHTHPMQEGALLGRLLELGIDAVLPRIPQFRQRSHQPWRDAIRYVPLYPCYLFVPLDIEAPAWRVALTLPGMRRFLGERLDHPIPIHAEFVEFSLSIAAARMAEVENEHKPQAAFNNGDRVKVLAGPFAEHEGIVNLTGTQRVAIMLNVFGRSVHTEVSAHDLGRL